MLDMHLERLDGLQLPAREKALAEDIEARPMELAETASDLAPP